MGDGLTSQNLVIYRVVQGLPVTYRRANPAKPCNLHGFVVGAWRPFKKIGGTTDHGPPRTDHNEPVARRGPSWCPWCPWPVVVRRGVRGVRRGVQLLKSSFL